MGSRNPVDTSPDDADQAPTKSVFQEYAETILVCVILVMFSRAFVVQQSEIPSGSMEDTILEGDYILVNRFQYAPTEFGWEKALLPNREVERGDIVVFKQPDQPEVDYIKRVVGLPGDEVVIRNDYVMVNGSILDEPYVGPLYHETYSRCELYRDCRPGERRRQLEVVVPAEHYFLMGDHRNMSQDSRVFGPVHGDAIKGRAFMILFSTRAKRPPGTQPGQVTVGSLLRKFRNLVFYMRFDRVLSPLE